MRPSARNFGRHCPHLIAEALRQHLAIAMRNLERSAEAQCHVDRPNRQKTKKMGAERHVPIPRYRGPVRTTERQPVEAGIDD